MQKTIREIRCDKCGEIIENALPQNFERIKLNGALYDLCNECHSNVIQAMTRFADIVLKTFENQDGYIDEWGKDTKNEF